MKSLDGNDLKERGLETETKGVSIEPDDGWRYNVGEAGLDAWQPKLDKYRADLKQDWVGDMLDHRCLDDWNDLSESSCFKRLKKRLTQKDLADLETWRWARKQGGRGGI